MEFWEKLETELLNGCSAVLLYVLSSEGSSPGRQGFKMFVSDSGKLLGSIGGGPMEHKLVELCKKKVQDSAFSPFLRRQVHKSNIPADKSGMNCSGEQTIGFYHLSPKNLGLIQQLATPEKDDILALSNVGLSIKKNTDSTSEIAPSLEFNEGEWEAQEQLSAAPELHIVGGGHVSEALVSLALQLEFRVNVYETRKDINTLPETENCSLTIISDYNEIGTYVTSGKNKYVVLMSFGFRTDKVALTALIEKDFKYIGMMGSKEKIRALFNEMISEGVDKSRIKKIYAPIGVKISSKTPMEIAVSVMAEVIGLKNVV